MNSISTGQLLEQLNWRYAVKKFDSSKKISTHEWAALEQALVLTPSSYGLQPWRFLVVQSPEVRRQLTPLTWKQTQVEDCSHFVVLTHLRQIGEEHIKKFVQSTAKIRGLEVEKLKGFQEMMIKDVVTGPRSKVAATWAAKQCYIAMGNLMTSAAMLAIDTCPMEGLDPVGYDKVLNLEASDYQTAMAVACGYRHVDDSYQRLKKSRFDVSDVVRTV